MPYYQPVDASLATPFRQSSTKHGHQIMVV